MEFIKDYAISILYHPIKANMVEEVLSLTYKHGNYDIAEGVNAPIRKSYTDHIY